MRLEHYPQQKLKKEMKSIIDKYLDPSEYEVFFFGSRVSGKGSERSDIDVGIRGKGQIPWRTLASIKDEIDGLPLLYKVDVVDFSSVSEDFQHIALEHVEPIL